MLYEEPIDKLTFAPSLKVLEAVQKSGIVPIFEILVDTKQPDSFGSDYAKKFESILS